MTPIALLLLLQPGTLPPPTPVVVAAEYSVELEAAPASVELD